MSNLLLSVYEFFRKNLLIFSLLIISIVGLSLFFASKLELKEDIAEMMPKDKRMEKMNLVFQNSKFSDKIIVNIFLKDTTSEADPELLTSFSDSLASALRRKFQPHLIEGIRDKVSDDAISSVFSTVLNNLPIYLTEDDYQRLDSLIAPENVSAQIERNYKTLISPASLVLKQFVLADPLGLSGNTMKKLQSLQVEDNYELFNGHIITKDHKNLLFFISPANAANETGKNEPLIHGIKETINEVSKTFQGKVEAQYFGAAAMAVGNAERIKSDLTITVTLAISVLVVFLGLFFRKAPVVLIIFLPVAIGGIISLAALYFIKGEVSAIALGMGSVLLGITVDYSLHIFTHFRSTGSVKAVLKDLPAPLMLSCLITAASFLCLLFVKSSALNDLGLFAAISVVNAMLAGVLILPHFLKKKEGDTNAIRGLSFLDKYTSYRFDKNRFLIGFIIVVTILSFFTSKNVSFETDMMKLNYVSEDLYAAEKNLQRISSLSLKSIYLVSSGENMQDALKTNEKVAEKIKELKSQGIIKSTAGVGDFIISDSLQKVRVERWKSFWTPEKKESVKQLLLKEGEKYRFRESAFAGFFAMLESDFNKITSKETAEMKALLFDDYISERNGVSTIVTLLKVDEEDKEAIYTAFPEEDNEVTVIDRKYLTSKFVELMRDDFNKLELLSLGLVFLVLIIVYGRIELGIIAFLPMLLSWIWTLGIMGLLGVKFNILNIIISTFILGLGIDYSIFIMSGLMEEYKKGAAHLGSFKTSIFLSAFTSVCGIGALIFAEHPALKSIAVLSIIGMCSVITISYTLMPLLFRLFISERAARGYQPYTAQSLLITIIAYTYFLLGCIMLTVLANLVFPILPIPLNKKKKSFHWLLSKFCWTQVYVMMNVPKKIINPLNENFSKPSVIVCNHQSVLDILFTIMLSPKLILVTNDWVWNSPFFGRVVRYANFFPASKGMETGIEELHQRIREGFSIVIFPEGTRSKNGNIARFHKGAFYLAEQLNVDILPIVMHGACNSITKGDLMLKNNSVTIKFLPRIAPENKKFGETYQERTKLICKHMRLEYGFMRKKIETPAYFRDHLVNNYIYKGPVLEWYMRIKTSLEKNYSVFDKLLPEKGTIVDVGCGYGFMTYMLTFLSEDRRLIGIDYDEEKIQVAANCYSKNERIDFKCADITNYDLPKADAFVLSDVLHYLPTHQQDKLIESCLAKLNDDGVILIQDGNSDLKKKHTRTRLTEFFSIKVLGFNKSENELNFVSGKYLEELCKNQGLEFEIVDKSKVTSNLLYVIKKKTAQSIAV